ncbi:MAG: hypothetical protein ACYTF1_14975 [Planctomycetota bacterium]|jgi:hypothetical protein
MDFVTVGDARNTADTRYYATGFGMVAYEYKICKYEVTDRQYCEFLNAVYAGVDDLIDAIGYLHMSLGLEDDRAGMSGSEVVWGDPTHVDDCHGGYKGVDVFQYEEEACDKLDAYIENDEYEGFGFGAAIEAIWQMLAQADQMLAATDISEAIEEDGNLYDIAVVKELMTEDDAAKAQGARRYMISPSTSTNRRGRRRSRAGVTGSNGEGTPGGVAHPANPVWSDKSVDGPGPAALHPKRGSGGLGIHGRQLYQERR